MLLESTRQNLRFSFVVFVVLTSLNLWSFQSIPDKVYDILQAASLLGIIISLCFYPRVMNKKLYFTGNVLIFLVIPFVSGIAAYIFHKQSYPLSLLAIRVNILWLFYFVLHAFDIPVKRLINFMIFTGLVWAFLTVVQQFTYPNYWFYTKEDSDNYSILRSGVFRFMLSGQHYGIFVLLYSLYRYLLYRKVSSLIFVGVALAGFYFYGTRQFAISAIVCMLAVVLIVKGTARWLALGSLAAGALVLVIFREQLFEPYIQMTRSQFADGENIRTLSGKFWLTEYWPHWLTAIFGNGTPHIDSPYGQEIEGIRSTFRYYRSDVGIIGSFNEFGLFYILNILWVNIKGLNAKYLGKKDKILTLFFLNSLILVITSTYYALPVGIPFYCLLFYLFEKAIEQNQRTKVVTQKSRPQLEKTL